MPGPTPPYAEAASNVEAEAKVEAGGRNRGRSRAKAYDPNPLL